MVLDLFIPEENFLSLNYLTVALRHVYGVGEKNNSKNPGQTCCKRESCQPFHHILLALYLYTASLV